MPVVKGSESMSVLTEIELRKQITNMKNEKNPKLQIPKGTIITPSAKSYLKDHQITYTFVDQDTDETDNIESENNANQDQKPQHIEDSNYKYQLHEGFISEKPEYMTILHQNVLVPKDNKRIIFRGKLDSLQAKILEILMDLFKMEQKELVADLSEILEFVRKIATCEFTREDLGGFVLLGLNPEELQEKAKDPEKHFGIEPFQPDYTMGEEIVWLNSIRAAVKETEISAYIAFKREDSYPERIDLIVALNRLADAISILMYKFRSGSYSR